MKISEATPHHAWGRGTYRSPEVGQEAEKEGETVAKAFTVVSARRNG